MGRIERVNEQIKREISDIIQRELGDPRLSFVTITQVSVSRDLRHARVSFSVLGDQKQSANAKASLDNARGLIRRYLSTRVMMRNLPELVFVHDNSLALSARIEEKLKEISDESETHH